MMIDDAGENTIVIDPKELFEYLRQDDGWNKSLMGKEFRAAMLTGSNKLLIEMQPCSHERAYVRRDEAYCPVCYKAVPVKETKLRDVAREALSG